MGRDPALRRKGPAPRVWRSKLHVRERIPSSPCFATSTTSAVDPISTGEVDRRRLRPRSEHARSAAASTLDGANAELGRNREVPYDAHSPSRNARHDRTISRGIPVRLLHRCASSTCFWVGGHSPRVRALRNAFGFLWDRGLHECAANARPCRLHLVLRQPSASRESRARLVLPSSRFPPARLHAISESPLRVSRRPLLLGRRRATVRHWRPILRLPRPPPASPLFWWYLSDPRPSPTRLCSKNRRLLPSKQRSVFFRWRL